MNLKRSSILATIALLAMAVGACQGSTFKAPRAASENHVVGGLIFDTGDEEIVSGQPFSLTVTVLDENGDVFYDYDGVIKLRVTADYAIPLRIESLQDNTAIAITPAVLRNFGEGQRNVRAVIDKAGTLYISGEELDSGMGIVGKSEILTVLDADGEAANDDDDDEDFVDPYINDSDGDGLSDNLELTLTLTDPENPDSDGDGLNDGAEVWIYESDPMDTDTDDDGILDGIEVTIWNTDPTSEDSDGDVWTDPDEVYNQGTDPADNTDYPTNGWALFRNSDPCGFTTTESDVLDSFGIPYMYFASNSMGQFDLQYFANANLAEEQGNDFYTDLENNREWFEAWVNDGGYLLFQAPIQQCSLTSWVGRQVPGDFTITGTPSCYKNITVDDPVSMMFNQPYNINSGHLSNWFNGSFIYPCTARDYITSSYGDLTSLASNDDNGGSVLAHLQLGSGCIVASTIHMAVGMNVDTSNGYRIWNNALFFQDVDNDGLSSSDEENLYGTDKVDPDSDSDGLLRDGEEVNFYSTDPLNINDPPRLDSDSDGLPDWYEINVSLTNPSAWSSDSDSLSDYEEYFIYDTDPWDADPDGDGLDDDKEVDFGTDPWNDDSDNDGLTDLDEVSYNGNANEYTAYPLSNADTNPNEADTDGDGFDDLGEISRGFDPVDPLSKPVIVFEEDFESGGIGWIHGGTGDGWALRTESYVAGITFSSTVYGTTGNGGNAVGKYEDSYLMSPSFDIPGSLSSATLSFDSFTDNEPCNFDLELLYISNNGGSSWTPLNTVCSPTDIINAGSNHRTWINVSFDISAYIGDTVMLGFGMSTQDAASINDDDGWYLDNIEVY